MSEITHRGAQMATFDFAENRPWRFLLPPVYRYLPKKYVDAFFEDGSLMLSSFKQFSKHEDEARQDGSEGRAMVSSVGGGRQFFAVIGSGTNAYVLCGSQILSKTILDAFPGCDAAIEITNTIEFAAAVSNQLAGFRGGLSGHCVYRGKILVRHVESDPYPLPENKGEPESMDRMFAATAQAAQHENLFLKHRKFDWQAEYRFVFNLHGEPDSSTVIKCPRALPHCRRVETEEIV